MNFLAHVYLSYNKEKLILGNFMGDFVKGNNFINYEKSIQDGILLHRAIDNYTDHHPVVLQSKDKLRDKYRHYSGVIIDIFYDHFLAADWTLYHDTPLAEFAQTVYYILDKHQEILPPKALHMLPYMIEGNWLLNYASKKGIYSALYGMSRRTKFPSKMDESIDELEIYYDDFKEEFRLFFPDIQDFASQWLKDNTTN